jgi:hypothetical protein
MNNKHAADWALDAPSPAQLSELFLQIKCGKIKKDQLQNLIAPPPQSELFDLIIEVEIPPVDIAEVNQLLFVRKSNGKMMIRTRKTFRDRYLFMNGNTYWHEKISSYRLKERADDFEVAKRMPCIRIDIHPYQLLYLINLQKDGQDGFLQTNAPNMFCFADKNSVINIARSVWHKKQWWIQMVPFGSLGMYEPGHVFYFF